MLLRAGLLNWQLPYYSVDENDVVEPALAFFSGDWEPRWYGYGPVFSYALAFIYKISMWMASVAYGWTKVDFFYAAFFEPTYFYVIARAFHALIVIAAAGVSWLFAKRYFNSQTALIALILGLAPFLDINTNFTIRIDTLLGLFSLLSLFFAAQFGQDRIKYRPYILSGIFAGFGIATKNLTGMLLLPALVFAHFLSVWQTKNLTSREKFWSALAKPNILVLLGAVVLGHSLANPYSVINFPDFLIELQKGFIKQSGEGNIFTYYRSPYDFRWLVSKWGWPMAAVVILALLASLRRLNNASRLLLVWIFVFVIAFLPFSTKDYWYNAIFPAVILLVALLVSEISQQGVDYVLSMIRRNQNKEDCDSRLSCLSFAVAISIVIILMFVPYSKTVCQNYANWFSEVTPLEKRADYAAQTWIEYNLPSHSSILLIGRHAVNLPRLVADKAKVQAVWGEYFSYNRDKYPHWCNEYENVYLLLQQKNKLMYHIINIRERYSIAPHDIEMNSFYRNNLDRIARDNGSKYVVIASPKVYKGTWEDNPKIKLIASFNHSTGHNGDEIKIFELQ